jgi:hypothetical protein
VKFYYRQPKLARRYDMSVRAFQRARQEGKIPPPDMYMGQNPMWSDETIAAFERASAKRAISPTSGSSESDGVENFSTGDANSA